MTNNPKPAYYSLTQENINKNIWYNDDRRPTRYNIYKLVDGREVMVTEVFSLTDGKEHKERFSDSIYLGVVDKWVRTVHW